MKFFKRLSFAIILSSFGLICFGQTNKSSQIICSNSIPANQPLWLMVLKNKTYIVDSAGASGRINPDYIENLRVLKGAQATSLYGYRAQNGVIIIILKKDKVRKEFRRLKPYLSKI